MSTRLRLLEAGYWVLAVTAGVVGGLGVLAFVFGDGLLTLKYLLFVVGFLLFGIGSVVLWRGTRRRPSIWPAVGPDVDAPSELGFERRLWDLPGLRGEYLSPEDRISRPVKLFLTGLAVLAVSYVMETVFGVAV
jgi:hypothetical protein